MATAALDRQTSQDEEEEEEEERRSASIRRERDKRERETESGSLVVQVRDNALDEINAAPGSSSSARRRGETLPSSSHVARPNGFSGGSECRRSRENCKNHRKPKKKTKRVHSGISERRSRLEFLVPVPPTPPLPSRFSPPPPSRPSNTCAAAPFPSLSTRYFLLRANKTEVLHGACVGVVVRALPSTQ